VRLIDADALVKIITEWPERLGILDNPTCEEYAERYGNLEALSAIRHEVEYQPTIDAVPVVRCKDCKHWGMLEGPPETENIKCCEFGQYMVGANGYCVYGEVKGHD